MTAIVVVVDISEKTDDFLKSKLPTWRIVTDYYFGFIPRIDAMLFPLFTFIAVIFFTSKMAARSEIVAILSSGITFRRFLVPYFVGGLLLTIMLWGAYQYVIPDANRKWGEFEKKYVDVNSSVLSYGKGSYKQNIFFRDDTQTYVAIKGYDTISKSGSNLSINRFADNKLIYNLRALNFSWDSTSKKWKLLRVTERRLGEINEIVSQSEVKLVAFNFKPNALRKDDYIKDQMNTADLDAYIILEKQRGSDMLNSLLLERYNRDAIPVSVLILSLIGAILASRKKRGGSGANLALGVLLSMLYVLASRLTVVFAIKGNFPPLLAAWFPNIIFGVLAIYLYRKAPK